MSSFLVGRTSLASGVILTVFYSTIFQPFLIHWIWHDQGWMRHSNFLNQDVSVKDHAGALVLHIPSVIFGAIGKCNSQCLQSQNLYFKYTKKNILTRDVFELNYLSLQVPSFWEGEY